MARNTIAITGDGIKREALASVITSPGHLCIIDSTGKVKPHNVAGGNCAPMFALEDDLQGNDKDDNYAVGALVQLETFKPGCVVYVRIANGEDIAIGDFLESAGDGTLQEVTTDSAAPQTENVVLQALTAVDMSDSSAADPSGWCEAMVV